MHRNVPIAPIALNCTCVPPVYRIKCKYEVEKGGSSKQKELVRKGCMSNEEKTVER